jgi:hypothetical protein
MDVKAPDRTTAEVKPGLPYAPPPGGPQTVAPLPGQAMPPPRRSRFTLSPINRRRLQNFKANRRGYWSFWLFMVLFVLTLFAEVIANDRPILASYKGELLFPIAVDYPEEKFGGFLAVSCTVALLSSALRGLAAPAGDPPQTGVSAAT